MSWAAVITGGASIIGGALGSRGAGEQADAAREGLDFTKQVYGDAQGNFQPYLQAGQGGLAGLQRLSNGDYGGFMNSPDYLAAMQGGVSALDHSAAANYRLGSGGYQVDLQNAGQQNAAQFLSNYRNSLQYLATSGQNAAGTLGGIGTQTSQQVNGAYGQIGDAAANRAGAWAGAVTGVAGAANNYLQGRAPTQSSYGSGGAAPVPANPWASYGGPT